MQCAYLPINICNKIDMIVRKFLWGTSEEKRKMHLVNWDKVTQIVNDG